MRQYDAVLHLLDRQIVTVGGRLAGKVDDLVLEPAEPRAEDAVGPLRVTGILLGPQVLGDRLGGWVGRGLIAGWAWLSPPDAAGPRHIPIAFVTALDSAVHLAAGAETTAGVRGSAADRPMPTRPVTRLGHLVGSEVVTTAGRHLGFVNDLRVAGPELAALTAEGIVVSGRHAGSMLGYDRRANTGPLIVAWAVRRLHRNAGYLPWTAVSALEPGRVVVDSPDLLPLRARRATAIPDAD